MNIIDQLSTDLSLRTPQKAALRRLDADTDRVPDVHHGRDRRDR